MTEEARPAEDVLSRALRLTLGGKEYVLAVLFIAGNERWREYERKTTAAFVTALEIKGQTTRQIIDAFATQTDLQLDLLYAYDTDCGHREGVLPPREELKEVLYEDDLNEALKEVVRAANPKAYVAAGAALQAMQAAAERLTQTPSSSPSSSSPASTGGPPSTSATH